MSDQPFQYLIDRFPNVLSEDEAFSLLSSSYIRFKKNGEPVDSASVKLMIWENKFLKLMSELGGDSGFNIELALPIDITLKQESWIKEHLTANEKSLLGRIVDSFSGELHLKLGGEETLIFVKLSCRDLLFPKFINDDFVIKGHYEMVFLFTPLNDFALIEVEKRCKDNGLYLRKIGTGE